MTSALLAESRQTPEAVLFRARLCSQNDRGQLHQQPLGTVRRQDHNAVGVDGRPDRQTSNGTVDEEAVEVASRVEGATGRVWQSPNLRPVRPRKDSVDSHGTKGRSGSSGLPGSAPNGRSSRC